MNSSIENVTLATDGCGANSIDPGAFPQQPLPSAWQRSIGMKLLPKGQIVEMMADDADTISFLKFSAI